MFLFSLILSFFIFYVIGVIVVHAPTQLTICVLRNSLIFLWIPSLVTCAKSYSDVWWLSACIDLWPCSSVYMHVCACVLGDKSLMWMTDSPGVSMMSRRQPSPRRGWKVGPFHTTPASAVYPSGILGNSTCFFLIYPFNLFWAKMIAPSQTVLSRSADGKCV